MEFIECKTQKDLEKCCKAGNIAVVRKGIFTAYGSSQVTAYDSSQVTAYGSSQVRAYGSSQVTAYDSSQVTAYGYVAITQQSDAAKIKKSRHCKLIQVPPISDIDDYCERYPVEKDGSNLIPYKAVSPKLKSLCSTTPIKYPKKGVIKNDKLDPPEAGSCANGLHFSHFDWAVKFGLQYGDFVILRARVAKDTIVVSPDCDGKIRTDEAEILEVITDWQHYNPFEGK